MEAIRGEGEDVWIPSACGLCMNTCSIRVHRQNGVLTKIEGNPDSPIGSGTLCPKGVSGIMLLYDPHRLRAPMKRTNPQKGIGIDPGWIEISWEEALETIAGRLKKIRAEDPRKLLVCGTAATIASSLYGFLFMTAFGSPNGWFAGAGIHCGNGWHLTSNLLYQSVGRHPDVDHCRYVLLFGSNWGTAAGYAFNMIAKKVADARRNRGMKMVVIDPYFSGSAEKADEWIPIRPGTDAALALAIAHVLVHEIKIYDAGYLKRLTNAPYLIGPDGLYLREEGSGKPLVWDQTAGNARPYDDPDLGDLALEGSYTVQGIEGRPAFELLREHLKSYTPEKAAEISTVPAEVTRRIAREFGEAACIGSTLQVGGRELPFRPVASHTFKGANAHRHQLLIAMAIDLLNVLVGAQDVPGGMLGESPRCEGFPETGRPTWDVSEGPDGLAVAEAWFLGAPHYPPHPVAVPTSLTLAELFPLATISPMMALTVLRPEQYRVEYAPEMLINYGSNTLMSFANEEQMAAWYGKIPFIVGVSLFLDESTDLFDLVLPDACYLERLDPMPNLPMPVHHTCSSLSDDWAYGIRQPAIPPRFQARHYAEVLLDLAGRAGFLPDYHAVLGWWFKIGGEYPLDPEKKYSWEEIADRAYRSNFGPEHGLEWFQRYGVLSWPRKPEEAYWRPFSRARVPLYYEYFLPLGQAVKEVTDRMEIDWDTSDYQPLPEWKPCRSHEIHIPDYDFYAFYYRLAWQTFSFTVENPWLDEVSRLDPYAYALCINTDTARRKEIADGDLVWMESPNGWKVKGRVKLTEGIHPEAAAVANCLGHWSPGMPIARGKGVFINHLQQVDHEHIDFTSGGLDLCHKVRIYRA